MNRGAPDFMRHGQMVCWRCCTNPGPMGKKIELLHVGCCSGQKGYCPYIYASMGSKGIAAVLLALVLPCIRIPAPLELTDAVLYNRLHLHHLLSYFLVPGLLQRSHPSARRSWGKPLLYLSLQGGRADYCTDLKTHLIMYFTSSEKGGKNPLPQCKTFFLCEYAALC